MLLSVTFCDAMPEVGTVLYVYIVMEFQGLHYAAFAASSNFIYFFPCTNFNRSSLALLPVSSVT